MCVCVCVCVFVCVRVRVHVCVCVCVWGLFHSAGEKKSKLELVKGFPV